MRSEGLNTSGSALKDNAKDLIATLFTLMILDSPSPKSVYLVFSDLRVKL